MITDERADDICHQVSRVRKELDHFKDVVANAVSRLNARIKALEQRLPPPRSRWRRFGARGWRSIADE
jgi:hypothetical protein